MGLRISFKYLRKEKILAGSPVFAGAGLFVAYGIILLTKIAIYSITGLSPFGGLPFSDAFANLLLSMLLLFASVPLFLAGYSLIESHYAGIVIAGVYSFSLFLLSFFGDFDTALGLTAGTLCLLGVFTGFMTRKSSSVGRTPGRIVEENIIKVCLRVAVLIATASLFAIIAIVFIRGSKYVSLTFLTSGTPPGSWGTIKDILAGLSSASFGIAPATVGSLVVCGVCELITIPLGLGSAIYLTEYAPQNLFTKIIHFFVELLAGIPSIILGIFGYTFFYYNFHWAQQSLLGGALCLAFMTLPWNIRVAEEAIRTVPADFRAASYALGSTKLQTIRRVVLESASPGILTGTLLGFGAAFGEAAVVIFTAGNLWNNLPGSPFFNPTTTGFPTLPSWIYGIFRGETPNGIVRAKAQDVAFAGSAVLIAIFLAITIVALLVRNRMRKKLGTF